MDGKCQTMGAAYDCRVTSPEPKKSTLGWQKQKGSKGMTTIKSRSITKDIHMKRPCVWHLKETLDVNPNLKCSVMRSATPYPNISKKCPLCLYEKLVIITY